MNDLQDTINSLAIGLHDADLIDIVTLRNLTGKDIPSVIEFTGDEIQKLRLGQKMSQAVFAKYLNISPAMVRSLEQGKRHAHGAILKLLNVIDRYGISVLN